MSTAASNKVGDTALHIAAGRKHIDAVLELLGEQPVEHKPSDAVRHSIRRTHVLVAFHKSRRVIAFLQRIQTSVWPVFFAGDSRDQEG
jgi:hypothetical protein